MGFVVKIVMVSEEEEGGSRCLSNTFLKTLSETGTENRVALVDDSSPSGEYFL